MSRKKTPRKKAVAVFTSGVLALTTWVLVATLVLDAPLRLIPAAQPEYTQYEEVYDYGYDGYIDEETPQDYIYIGEAPQYAEYEQYDPLYVYDSDSDYYAPVAVARSDLPLNSYDAGDDVPVAAESDEPVEPESNEPELEEPSAPEEPSEPGNGNGEAAPYEPAQPEPGQPDDNDTVQGGDDDSGSQEPGPEPGDEEPGTEEPGDDDNNNEPGDGNEPGDDYECEDGYCDCDDDDNNEPGDECDGEYCDCEYGNNDCTCEDECECETDSNDCKCECYDECDEYCACECEYDDEECKCECEDECDDYCACECEDDDNNDNIVVGPGPGGSIGGDMPEFDCPDAARAWLDAMICELTQLSEYYRMQYALINEELSELSREVSIAREAQHSSSGEHESWMQLSSSHALEWELSVLQAQAHPEQEELRARIEEIGHWITIYWQMWQGSGSAGIAPFGGYIGIAPFSMVPSGITPIGVIHDVTHGGTGAGGLRAALSAASPRSARLMNDVIIDGTTAIAVTGLSYVFSNSLTMDHAYTITRNSGTVRHFTVSGGTTVLTLHNVRLTSVLPAGTGARGGVSIAGGNLHIRGATITGNRAANGGGLTNTGGTINVHHGIISNNIATARGGGVFSGSGTTHLHAGALIDGNRSYHTGAPGGGGGLAVDTGSTVNINGATISNNHAENFGGGISVAWGGTGSANLNISGMTLSGNNAVANGGGMHTNSAASLTMEGLIIIDGNTAREGGGMRVFSRSDTNFSLSPGSVVSNNIARGLPIMAGTPPVEVGRSGGHGAGISIAHTGIGAADSNANGIGLRVDGVTFANNIAVGIGGAIHHEAPAMTAARGIVIANSTFTGNRASDGGAISMVASTTNLPITAHAARLTITNTTFSGNTATNGLLPDENLAVRNITHITSIGSPLWYGPRIDTAGVVVEVALRNHIWNNYDVMTRNQLEARNVSFHPIGTAAANSTMTARLTQTYTTTNPTAAAIALATTAPVTVSPPITLPDGRTVIRHSLTTYEVLTYPWNAQVTNWVNNQTVRTFVAGDMSALPPNPGHWTESTTSNTIANTTTILEDIVVAQHTLVQPRIDYINHNVTFTVSPTQSPVVGTLTEGASTGLATVTRTLRQSRSAADHAADPNTVTNGGNRTGDRGAPIGTPPTPVNGDYVFLHWVCSSDPATPLPTNYFATAYVGGPRNFLAIFGPGTTNVPVAVSKTVTGDLGDRTRGFWFTVTFTNAANAPLTGTKNFTRSGTGGTSTGTATLDSNGSFRFQLQHGQTITFADVLSTTQVRVVEDNYPLYTTTIVITGSAASPVTLNNTRDSLVRTIHDTVNGLEFDFYNNRSSIPPTGIHLVNTGGIMILLGALLFTVFSGFVIVTRRKRVV